MIGLGDRDVVADRQDRCASVSVCIVSFRCPDGLDACLRSLRKHHPELPVHVWDNRSDESDHIRELSVDWPEVQWTFSPQNVGFAAAVNELALRAAPDDLLLVNPDAEITSDLHAVLGAAADPRAAAVAPGRHVPEGSRARPWDNAHRRPGTVRSLVSYAGYAGALRGTWVSDLHSAAPDLVSGYLDGACLLVTRRAWDDVGPFDEAFFVYGEEVEWQQRAVARGWTLHLAGGGRPAVRHRAKGTTTGSTVLSRRSDDLLHANHALMLDRVRSRPSATAFTSGSVALAHVQRSKRRARRPGTRSVLLTSNDLRRGGAERQRVLLANGLAARGTDVTFVCLQRLGPLVRELDPAVRLLLRPWWLPETGVGRGSVLITGNTNTELGFGTMWRRLGPERRWAVAVHLGASQEGPTFTAAQARAIRGSDTAVALGGAHWNQLTSRQPLHERVRIIPNGVDPGTVARRSRPGRAPRLVMLGRVDQNKNHAGLIRALSELVDHPWVLDIYGDGPARVEVDALVPPQIRDRVRWRGWASDADEALADADVLCVPSLREGHPLVVLEAMARRVTVLASAVGEIPDMLEHGRCGVLVESPDVAPWREALRSVLDGSGRPATMLDEAYRAWNTRFRSERMVEAYLRLVEDLGTVADGAG